MSDAQRTIWIGQILYQHGEVVAVEMRHQVVRADRVAEPAGNGAQQAVAG